MPPFYSALAGMSSALPPDILKTNARYLGEIRRLSDKIVITKEST